MMRSANRQKQIRKTRICRLSDGSKYKTAGEELLSDFLQKTEFWFTMDIMEIQASVTSSGKSSLPMARVTAAQVRHIMWTMMRSR